MNLLAALIFFTRLPFWRIKEVPAECFKHVVPYWPFVGWITGGITAAVLWLCGQVFPISLAWIIAIVTRLLITGCLHEDGFADFLDGFGGGTTHLGHYERFTFRNIRSNRSYCIFLHYCADMHSANRIALYLCIMWRLLV